MFKFLCFGKNHVKEETEMSTFKNMKDNTAFGGGRKHAIIAGSCVVVLALTIAITAIALSMRGKSVGTGGDAPEPVNTAVVFSSPLADYTSVLKGCSMTQLQYNETMKRWESHKLVDLEAPLGTAVLATFGGTVTSVRDHTMYGRQVTIDHGRDGLVSVYSNLDPEKMQVREGDTVQKGQAIGAVGQTSKIEFTQTPHLRIEVLKNGKRIDPNDYIDFSNK